jgi:hypothetical protein
MPALSAIARRIRRSIATAIVTGAGLLATAAPAWSQQVGSTPVEIRVPQPPTPARALGRVHLAYELHLTNFGAEPLRLLSVDVLSGEETVSSLEGARLAQRTSIVGAPPSASRQQDSFGAGAHAVVYLWITLAPGTTPPQSLAHRLTIATGDTGSHSVTAGHVKVVADTAPVLAAPVRGGPWVAIRGPSNSSGHRLAFVTADGATRVPQRFAVDWAKLGSDGRLFRGDSTANEGWYGYRDTVYAAAAGRVAIARDGAPDNPPLSVTPPAIIDAREAPGNVVSIDIGDGRFVSYAHLARGSLLVRTGDVVREGQAIGLIGNSGNSLAPHLHFQVADAAEVLISEGLPFQIRTFDLIGLAQPAALLSGQPWTASPQRPSRVVEGEMPLENMVVRFPAP